MIISHLIIFEKAAVLDSRELLFGLQSWKIPRTLGYIDSIYSAQVDAWA